MAVLDLFLILCYLLAMVGIGVYFSRKNKSSEQFTTASGSIPGWALGLSFYATFLSAITFLGDPGKSFGANWNPFVFSLSIPLAAIVATKWFVPFYRESGEISAYTHLEKRFGNWARTYAMVCFIMTQLARMGTIFYGIALTLNALTGIDMRLIILVAGLCIILYTVLGGMEAVIWTEVIQAVLKTLGAGMILYLITLQTPLSAIIKRAVQEDKFSLGTFDFNFQTSSFWVILGYGFFINLTNFGIDQNYIQRYHTAKNPRDAAKSIWLCVLYYVPVSFLFFFIGTALYSFYAENPALILELKQQVSIEKNIPLDALQASDYGDRVLPYFMKTQIPTGFLGLLIAALLSAGMSTMSSGMNSSATVFLKDIYLRYIDPEADAKKQFRLLLIATTCMGGLGIVFGISMIGVKSLLDVWWKLSGIFAGGMLGIFLLGFLAKKVRNFEAKIAAIIGLLLIALMSFKDNLPEALQIPLDSKMTVVVGTVSIVGIGVLIQKLRTK
ncbi:sodium:solute symporter [Aquirufa lenticrescens]|uniref:sodium:solute symporter n=1 Tax=Aquirufa lenticrescens TaxID=2696560 RepID=UPI001CAA5F14|nr:sodium:solute symporter [Aquirufa lenticrescens]UAJ13993.1 sodium:solute symporter [Aquirufa lenticrescens]